MSTLSYDAVSRGLWLTHGRLQRHVHTCIQISTELARLPTWDKEVREILEVFLEFETSAADECVDLINAYFWLEVN